MASQTTHFDHIAAFVDDSGAANAALEAGIALRSLSGGRLSVVHIVPSPAFLLSLAASVGGAVVHDDAMEIEAAQMWLDGLGHDIEGAEAVLLEGNPPKRACEWAEEAEVDVMIATRHRGRVERTLLGSFAGHLSHHAPSAVLLTQPAEESI